jgi:hypothetical protein
MPCRHCEDLAVGGAIAELLSSDSAGMLVFTGKPPFDPIKMMCFAACCDLCGNCHHYLCCACWKAGVRVDYAGKRFVEKSTVDKP